MKCQLSLEVRPISGDLSSHTQGLTDNCKLSLMIMHIVYWIASYTYRSYNIILYKYKKNN